MFGIFITLFTFAVPLSLTSDLKYWLFLGLGVIGIFFSLIILRYREFKEAYWLACRTLTIFGTLNTKITKQTIQSIFHYCMRKNGDGYYIKDENIE